MFLVHHIFNCLIIYCHLSLSWFYLDYVPVPVYVNLIVLTSLMRVCACLIITSHCPLLISTGILEYLCFYCFHGYVCLIFSYFDYKPLAYQFLLGMPVLASFYGVLVSFDRRYFNSNGLLLEVRLLYYYL